MPRKAGKKTRRTGRGKSAPRWADWPESRLLDLKMRSLHVHIEGSPLEARIRQVLGELRHRGIRFRPHFWVSDEWFTPAAVPGCAVPFYLLHPRLVRLERRRMLEAEGADRTECMKILRHEVGHAIDHAYRLNRRRLRQKLFGKSSKAYPKMYLPKPHSRDFVQHLDYWYAQAHPDEDFAETFAVWLTPRSSWRKRYAGWGALKKLEYMDDLMKESAGRPPAVRSRKRVAPLSEITKTLREHYTQRQKRYAAQYPEFIDADLRKLFSSAEEFSDNERAAAFLRRARSGIRRMLSRWTGHNQYSLDLLLKEVIRRCVELDLHLIAEPEETMAEVATMLTVNTMEFMYAGRRWLSL